MQVPALFCVDGDGKQIEFSIYYFAFSIVECACSALNR